MCNSIQGPRRVPRDADSAKSHRRTSRGRQRLCRGFTAPKKQPASPAQAPRRAQRPGCASSRPPAIPCRPAARRSFGEASDQNALSRCKTNEPAIPVGASQEAPPKERSIEKGANRAPFRFPREAEQPAGSGQLLWRSADCDLRLSFGRPGSPLTNTRSSRARSHRRGSRGTRRRRRRGSREAPDWRAGDCRCHVGLPRCRGAWQATTGGRRGRWPAKWVDAAKPVQ